MAGTVSSSTVNTIVTQSGQVIKKVTISWVGDAANGTIPNTTISGLCGYCIKVVTNPGSPAPTANYDIAFGDPDDTTLDAFGGQLADRHTTNTEQVYPKVTGSLTPVFLCGDYQLQITNQSVNSATGTITLYIKENL